MLGPFLISSFGLDAINVIRPPDYAAVRLFREQGGPRPPDPYYLLLLNPGDHPTSPDVRDGKHPVLRLEDLEHPATEKKNFQGAAEVKDLTDRLLKYSDAVDKPAHLFALWSPVGQQYGEAYGIQTPGQSAALRDAFLQSSYWTTESEEQGTYLFRFEPDGFERNPS